ncbi:MAG TPA: WxcM-like domain-containing protein, partial [Pseudomonadales bacterium]
CEYLKTYICEGASIGANATILPGLKIGKNAMIGAGAVVTRDVPPNAIVIGNPAFIKGYANTENRKADQIVQPNSSGVVQSSIKGVRYKTLPVISDLRGSLSFAEINQHLPFIPKRYFLVYDVPSQDVRGEHAHKELSQFLICVKGSCAVMLDDGQAREEYTLTSPGQALLIPPMVWGVQYKYSSDAVLLVLASDVYKESDYIRDYGQFLNLCIKDQ